MLLGPLHIWYTLVFCCNDASVVAVGNTGFTPLLKSGFRLVHLLWVYTGGENCLLNFSCVKN